MNKIMRRTLASLSVACFVSFLHAPCYGGEFSFRGVTLGKTIEESGMTQCNKRTPNIPCYDQDDYEKSNGLYTMRYLPDIGIGGHTQIEVKDGIITKLYFQFPTYETATLAKVVEQKYGIPKTSTTKVQNKMGAAFENIEFKWKVKGYEISVSRYGLDLNTGMLIVDEPASRGKMSKKEKDAIAKAKNNL